VGLLLAGPVGEGELRVLQEATARVREHYAHARRRIASEAGEAGSHQLLLSALREPVEEKEDSGRLLA